MSAIGVVDSHPSTMIKFETHELQPHFPYHVALLVHVECMNNTIKHRMIDEGIVAYVMSLSCWKGLGSPMLPRSITMLTSFDGRYFWPHGILPSLEVQLGGKTVMIKVEVVDAPLDYNLLLGHNWIYNMTAVVASLFRFICFPFEGRNVTVNKEYFYNFGTKASSRATIPVIDNNHPKTKNVGVGMYPSLMGTFNFSTPILTIGSILGRDSSSLISVPFRILHLEDPWTRPSPST